MPDHPAASPGSPQGVGTHDFRPRDRVGESTEGRIKFRLCWTEDEAPPVTRNLIYWRNRLYRAGLIGAYPDGTGYGNLSLRLNEGFLISGSGTGIHSSASAAHFTRVTRYSFESTSVHCRGPVKASSESLSHAAVYEAAPAVTAVVHAHHKGMWNALLGKVHTTAPEASCGTVEMALAITELFRESNVEAHGFFVMGGHEEGLVAFGRSLRRASLVVLRWLHLWQRASAGASQSG